MNDMKIFENSEFGAVRVVDVNGEPCSKGGQSMHIEITLKELNGKQIPAVTSLQVAEAFGKRHDHVIRDIREVMA